MADPRPRGQPRKRPSEPPVLPAEPVPAAEPPPPSVVAPPPEARVPTDFDALRAIGEMDRAEVAAMLDAFSVGARAPALRQGQRIRARVSRLGAATAFLDVGGKADGVIDRLDLGEGVNVGDTVDVFVLSTRDGEVRLTRTPSGEGAREMLREAKDAGMTVSGRVVSANEHGVQVELGDGVRAFCPLAQLSRLTVEDAGEWVGRSVAFRVLDVRGRDVLVSHKSVEDEEAKDAAAQRLAALREGDVYDGEVTRIAEFGAFVKIPGEIEGLVHVSNIRRERTNHPSEVLKEGQAVRVRVLAVDAARQRLNLGIKQAEDAPTRAETAPTTSRGFDVFAGLLRDVKVRR